MEITNTKYNTMPEQVQENKENIKRLAESIAANEIWNAKTEIDETASAIALEQLVDPSSNPTGYIMDTVGKLFKIVSVSDNTAYIKYAARLPQGATGPMGPQGAAGQNGLTPTITATVSVLNGTGTPKADVVKTGTDANPNFAFTFNGIKGEQGEPGPVGATGPQGPQGNPGEGGLVVPNGNYNLSLPDTVTADTTDGIILHDMQLQQTNGGERANINLTLPIVAGEGVTIDADEDNEKIKISAAGGTGGKAYFHTLQTSIFNVDLSRGQKIGDLYFTFVTNDTTRISTLDKLVEYLNNVENIFSNNMFIPAFGFIFDTLEDYNSNTNGHIILGMQFRFINGKVNTAVGFNLIYDKNGVRTTQEIAYGTARNGYQLLNGGTMTDYFIPAN